MKKKVIVAVSALSMLFGGVVGASTTKLIYTKEGLKQKYTEEFNKFAEELNLDLRVYEEDKVVQLEKEAEKYFQSKKKQYKQDKYKQIDAEYEQAKKEVFKHIDQLFKQ
jgi:gas vesicle protein